MVADSKIHVHNRSVWVQNMLYTTTTSLWWAQIRWKIGNSKDQAPAKDCTLKKIVYMPALVEY